MRRLVGLRERVDLPARQDDQRRFKSLSLRSSLTGRYHRCPMLAKRQHVCLDGCSRSRLSFRWRLFLFTSTPASASVTASASVPKLLRLFLVAFEEDAWALILLAHDRCTQVAVHVAN